MHKIAQNGSWREHKNKTASSCKREAYGTYLKTPASVWWIIELAPAARFRQELFFGSCTGCLDMFFSCAGHVISTLSCPCQTVGQNGLSMHGGQKSGEKNARSRVASGTCKGCSPAGHADMFDSGFAASLFGCQGTHPGGMQFLHPGAKVMSWRLKGTMFPEPFLAHVWLPLKPGFATPSPPGAPGSPGVHWAQGLGRFHNGRGCRSLWPGRWGSTTARRDVANGICPRQELFDTRVVCIPTGALTALAAYLDTGAYPVQALDFGWQHAVFSSSLLSGHAKSRTSRRLKLKAFEVDRPATSSQGRWPTGSPGGRRFRCTTFTQGRCGSLDSGIWPCQPVAGQAVSDDSPVSKVVSQVSTDGSPITKTSSGGKAVLWASSSCEKIQPSWKCLY